MDHSITRRGSLCWYKKEEVGLIAINDCFFLEQGIYQLIRKFRSHKNYVDIVDLFLETTQKTVYGQSLDLLVSPTGQKVDLNKFDIDRYLTIAKYKTAYYSCSLPIRLAFYLCEIDKEDLHLKIEDLMSKVGIFLQIQDDYLDAFGDPKVIGKIGTDIQDGKCCWPIVMSLKLATNDQKEILYENYGIDNEDCVQKVKEIYKELNIEKLFKDHEDQLYKELMVLFNRICEQTNLPESIFKFQVDNLYKRNH
ncbi:hypothetical protein RND71_043699 [Anisodus tanguticus]|uniref:Farnesyl pyrophosphate synthase n=1 Tax=Anisodus tanguticus TaxID=243964 RepID=A0AAE1QPU0_9SOLA|nr:hypothetical protein RND71_043699 [Anisodus tanguticus]